MSELERALRIYEPAASYPVRNLRPSEVRKLTEAVQLGVTLTVILADCKAWSALCTVA